MPYLILAAVAFYFMGKKPAALPKPQQNTPPAGDPSTPVGLSAEEAGRQVTLSTTTAIRRVIARGDVL